MRDVVLFKAKFFNCLANRISAYSTTSLANIMLGVEVGKKHPFIAFDAKGGFIFCIAH
tara:strand:+ start:1239 stop:1412 length:174 start_codon:yes stop_codon:yes gene_type:complete